ncbi:BCAM0308 family protein [Piscinibacter sp.]|jgi:NMD protein affecting ribosome stability and mRNA decay|uniref:BCAM0308 family protein n=1 Tax=Piscinibacter sp. TaxID=1903157 RepID=UPI0035599142
MSKHSKATRFHTIGAPVRGAGVIVEREHDAYQSDHKPTEPTVCPQCRAAFHEGRWQWIASPAGSREELCPACKRIRDKFPAGFVTLEGDFFAQHRDELMKLVNNRAERAKAEHPLQRIMAIEDTAGGALITTTDIHLARGIGEALHHAHQGELKFHYEQGQTLLRVHWNR